MTLTLLIQLADWALFIGRFHPLLVHLPIGFLLLAAILEVGRRTGNLSVTEATKSFILLASAMGATLACVTGLLLASGEGYEEELVNQHKWQGVAVAGLTWLTWLSTRGGFLVKFGWLSSLYTPSFLLALLFTFFAGHVGGSLTHGEGYLMQYAPNSLRTLAGLQVREATDEHTIKPLENVQEARVYQDIVQPILHTRCVQCHGRSKQKGKLRLDDYERVLKGGMGGPGLIAGEGAKSPIVTACLLPLEADGHMPPKGKPQLTSAQIGLIAWWIDQGAPEDRRVAELDKSAEVEALLEALGGGQVPTQEGGKGATLQAIEAPAPEESVILELRKQNVIVLPLAKGSNLLEISAINVPSFSDQQVTLLERLSENIVWLKLGSTAISDKSIPVIARFNNLRKLHLENTAVADGGVGELSNMQNLEYLNLIGTQVTDAGVNALVNLKSLRSLYIWQTGVTKEGVAKLKNLRPDLHVVTGLTEEKVQQLLQKSSKESPGVETKAD